VGPTASGKSELAVRLAEAFGGEVVGCDSMQIYRGLDAGTGKPDPDLRARVTHHLVDLADPARDFNLGDYVRLAEVAVGSILRAGRVPVIVGGTGLYLQGLLRGVFAGPRRDEALRARLHAVEAKRGSPTLHRMLRRRDPATAARLGPRDTQRIVRALEVGFLTGKPLSEHLASEGFGHDRWPAIKIGLRLPRDLQIRAIEARVDRFLASGWAEEVRRLVASDLPENANCWKALGYREIRRFVRGETGEAEARATIVKETRQYAKRQMTWFRGEPDVTWYEHAGEPPWEAIREWVASRTEKARGDL
jgi:tRNA dimethylallyltransferase